MKKLIALIILSIYFTTGYAQPGDFTRGWTLEECMEYAVVHNPKSKKQAYTNENYRQNYIEAISNLVPYVGASANTTWGFGRSIDPGTNTYSNISNFNNYYSVSASMPIFNGFVGINNVRTAKISRLRGVEEFQKVSDDIALATMQAYFDVVYYTEAVKLAQEQFDESSKNLAFSLKQEELGLKGRPDVAQVEAQNAADDYNLTRQKNLLDIAILNLKDNMYYPFEDELQIDTGVMYEAIKNNASAVDIFKEARENLPVAKIADYRLREAELGYSIAKGYMYPRLSASGGYSTNYYKNLTGNSRNIEDFGRQFKNNGGEIVGLSISIPIFNNHYYRSNAKRSRNNLRIVELENKETMRELQNEIEQAVMDVEGLAKELTQTIKSVLAYEEAHKANQRKYEQGLISALELQTSANQLLMARSQQLQTKLQYIIKSRMLEFYKGEPLVYVNPGDIKLKK